MVFHKNKQKGGALFQALLVVFASSAAVSTFMLENQRQLQVSKLESIKKRRNDLGAKLAANLTNSNYIDASTAKNIPHPGNQMLRLCLGYDYLAQNTIAPSASSGVAPQCDPTREYEFMLVPVGNYQFMSDKSDNKNCPRPALEPDARHISCFLAGKKAGRRVGYNFDGEVGRFSKKFPLKASVFFQPVCKVDEFATAADKRKKCYFAESVKFRYELAHHPTSNRETGILGTYPKDKNWMEIHSSKIVGKECNIGAKVYASKQTGQLECKCHQPYKPLESSPGVPAKNARGPVCELQEKLCPRGLILVGRKPNGDPICESPNKGTYGFYKEVKSTNLLGLSCRTDNGIGAQQNEVSGWVAKMHIFCRSHLEFVEESGRGFDMRAVFIGAGVGGGAALLLMALTFGAGFGPLLFVIGLAVLGAVIGSFFGMNEDWHLEPKSSFKCLEDTTNNNAAIYCPDVECTYLVECRAFKN